MAAVIHDEGTTVNASVSPQRRRLLAGLSTLLMAPWAAHAEGGPLAVIVAKDSKAPAKVGSDELSAIFLGTAKSFGNGERAVPVDQKAGSDAYGEFYRQVAGKTENQLKAYWSRIIFTGKGQPPQEAGDGAAVKKLVATNPNLVGYIDASQVDASVRVIAEIK